jgi:rSAM/selenodomain-associated transferase 1
MAVMAKAPQAGRVKTRLVPPLTPEAALELCNSFLRDTTGNLALAARDVPIQGYVAFAPAGSEALFHGLVQPGTEFVLADGTISLPPRVRGLGRCLLHAARLLLAQGFGSVCLLDADSPTLPTSYLQQAARALAAPGDRVLLGPAEDGGYYLIGLKAPHGHLFEDVSWSTDRVYEQTRARAAALSLEVVNLPTWYDVDERSGLRRLWNDLCGASAPCPDGGFAYPAPATARCIRRLGLGELLVGAASG